MNEDIGQILENWPFDPENSIRKVIDSSGVEKIQVRVDQGAFQGVLQMNLDQVQQNRPNKLYKQE